MMVATAPQATQERTYASRYRKHRTPRLATRFFGPGQQVLLFAVVVLVAVVLFPRQLIDQQLDASVPPSNATLIYLEQLARAKPDDEDLQLQLAGERLRAGQLDRVEAQLTPLLHRPDAHTPRLAELWLQLRRQQYFAAPEHTARRERAREAYAAAFREAVPWLGPHAQLDQIANARDAGLYGTAAALAGNLLSRIQPPGGHRTASSGTGNGSPGAGPFASGTARVLLHPGRLVGMVWSPDLDLAPIARARREKAATAVVDVRTRAFDALVQSHLAAGHPDAALRAAQDQIDKLDPVRVDWPEMIRLANRAGRPAAGEAFARRWLASAGGTGSRWNAFQALVAAYLAANQPKQALAAAEAHLADVPENARLWRMMTRLALQAGDNEKAAYYARRLVGLGGTHAG